MNKIRIAGWLFATASFVGSAVISMMGLQISRTVGLDMLGVCVFGIAMGLLLALWPVPTPQRDGYKLHRVRDWKPYREIDSFRLGQWAALIDGYDFHPDPQDDPGYRPWKQTFFFLKRSIEAGKFKPDGVTKPTRETIVRRQDLRSFYEGTGKRPRILFD